MIEPDCRSCPLAGKKARKRVGPERPSWASPGGAGGGLAIVGEQPWIDEAREGRPFVGASGKLLNGLLQILGADRSKVYVDNAIACFAGEWPTTDAAKKAAMEAAWRACRGRMASGLEEARPAVVLALGGTAVQALLNDPLARIMKLRGTVMAVPLGGRAIPMTAGLHPSAVLRGSGQEADVLRDDIAKALRWLAEGGPRVEPFYWTVCKSAAEWDWARWYWSERGVAGEPLCIDIETRGRNHWTCSVRVVGLGAGDHVLILPWEEWQSVGVPADEWLYIRAGLREILLDPTWDKLFHNQLFDVPVLEREVGPVRGLCHDTMVGHHTLYMKGVFNGLGYVSARYLDVPAWKVEFDGKFDAPLPELAEYNATDVSTTSRTWVHVRGLLQRDGLWGAYLQDVAAAGAAWRMSHGGIPVDNSERMRLLEQWDAARVRAMVDAYEASGAEAAQAEVWNAVAAVDAAKWSAIKIDSLDPEAPPPIHAIMDACTLTSRWSLEREHQKRLAESANKLKDAIHDTTWSWQDVNADGDARQRVSRVCAIVRTACVRLREAAGVTPFFNLQSDQHVGVVVHEWLGYEPQAPPTSKGYAVSAEALSHLRETPFVEAYQRHETAATRAQWLRELAVYPDGRVHPVYKTHTTPSSRWACGDAQSDDVLERGNFQNVMPELIGVFRAPDDRVFVGADFHAAEMVTVAWMSGCKAIHAQLERDRLGQDIRFHGQTARIIWPEWATCSLDEQVKRYVKSDLYMIAKTSGFQFIYGGGPEAFFARLKPTLPVQEDKVKARDQKERLREACQEVHQTLNREWWEVKELNQRQFYHAKTRGWLRSGWRTGRIIRFPLVDRDHVSPTFTANVGVQTTAREFVVESMIKVESELPEGAFLVSDTHDHIMVECWESQAEAVKGIMEQAMYYELPTPHGPLYLYAEAKVGKSWKDVK